MGGVVLEDVNDQGEDGRNLGTGLQSPEAVAWWIRA